MARRRSARCVAGRADRATPADRRGGVMKSVVLITGASSGIGSALAKVFAAHQREHGHELALVARRGDRLETLAGEIAASGHPRPAVIAVDLERRDGASAIAAELSSR